MKMAKGIIKKVVQRAAQVHPKCRGKTTFNRFSTTSEHNSLLDNGIHNPSGFATPGNNTLWMKPAGSAYFRDNSISSEINQLKDDEDIKREILSENSEVALSKMNHNTMIDTHALVKHLMESGFTPSQAESITVVMVRIIHDNTENLHSSMVSKPQAELTLQKIAAQLAILRRDMMIMEKTDFTELVTKIERITYELEQLQKTMSDEINKVAGNLTLDLNLEKGKVKDMHIDHLKAIEAKHAVIFEKINNLEKELQNLRSYVNTENATLQTIFERYKSDTMKLAFGAVATCMTIVLGFYRLWS